MFTSTEDQDKVLDIVEDVIKQWQNAMTQRTTGGGVYEPAMDKVDLKITDAQKKILELVSDKNERANIVEQSLLASLNEKDFDQPITYLIKLMKMVGYVIPSDLPEFTKKIKEKKGLPRTTDYSNYPKESNYYKILEEINKFGTIIR